MSTYSSDTQSRLASLVKMYSHVYVIVSPPRCSSTAFARVFWEQPTVRYYCHEPFEVVYYQRQSLESALDKLEHPLDLKNIKTHQTAVANSLVIKEMPYQVGTYFSVLASLATQPMMFLIRDPRLNISSRMAKKRQVGDSPLYPFVESGWDLLLAQVHWCQERHQRYIIVDSTDFRNAPSSIFGQLFAQLQLPFSETMLSWKSSPDMDIDNLDGKHRHLYIRVLESTGMEPATEPIPDVRDFPSENHVREHVIHCMGIYETLQCDSARIMP